MKDVDVGRAKRVVAVVEQKGQLTPEECMQLVEAGIPIYSYVSPAAVKAGDVGSVPAKVLEIIESYEEFGRA